VGYNAASRTSFKWVNEEIIQDRREVMGKFSYKLISPCYNPTPVLLLVWYLDKDATRAASLASFEEPR